MQCGVQHAGHAHVVDVSAVTESERFGFVLYSSRADSAGRRERRYFTLCDALDCVENFCVSRATTQVGSEVAGHVFSLKGCTLLVDLRLGANDDAGDTKATLQTTACRERLREFGALFFGNPLECCDLRA
jgi:hypothetical protein